MLRDGTNTMLWAFLCRRVDRIADTKPHNVSHYIRMLKKRNVCVHIHYRCSALSSILHLNLNASVKTMSKQNCAHILSKKALPPMLRAHACDLFLIPYKLFGEYGFCFCAARRNICVRA